MPGPFVLLSVKKELTLQKSKFVIGDIIILYGVKQMVEREYAVDLETSDDQIITIINGGLLEKAIESLSEEHCYELAKKMKVQVRGFRANKAPRNLLLPAIMYKAKRMPGPILVLEAISADHPDLLAAIQDKEKELDIEKWKKVCGEPQLFYVLAFSHQEKHMEMVKKYCEKEKEAAATREKKGIVNDIDKKDASLSLVDKVEELQQELERKNQIIAEKDRLISQKAKEIKKIEGRLKQERTTVGKRSNELGDLRKKLGDQVMENKRIQERLKYHQEELDLTKQENSSLKKAQKEKQKQQIVEQEIANRYGENLNKLLKEKQRYQKYALIWEARWQVNKFLQEISNKQASVIKTVSIEAEEVKKGFLLTLKQKEAKLTETFVKTCDLGQRKEHLLALQELLNLEELLTEVSLLEGKVNLDANIKLNPIEICECQEIEGLFYYEGPHGWVRTTKGSFLITPEIVVAHNLITGDRLRLTINNDFIDHLDTGVSVEVISKAEIIEQVCSLQKVDEEILANNSFSYAVQLTLGELEKVGCNLADPVTVVFPDLSLTKLPEEEVVYARIVKLHDHTWQKAPPKERKRCEKKRHSEITESESLAPILKGQTVLIVGGDSFKQQLKETIESRQGNCIFQPGFGEKGMVESRVKRAQIVIIITQELSHSISDLVIKAAAKHNVDYYYYNERGAVLFNEFLQSLAS